MAAFVTQQMEPFDLSGDSNTWTFYVGRLRHLLLANEVERDDIRRSVLLASCGLPTYNLIQKVLFPVPGSPTDLASFDNIADEVRRHLDRRPSTLALSFAQMTLDAEADVSNEAPAAPRCKACQKKYMSTTRTQSQSLTGGAAVKLPMDLPSASIMCLPQEMLVGIFKMLDVRDKCRVAQVCRRWRDTIEVGVVWRDTMVKVGSSESDMFTLPILSRRGVLQIKITGSNLHKNVNILKRFFYAVPLNLTHLHLSKIQLLSSRTVRRISQLYPQLVSLKLHFCYNLGKMYQITDACIASICTGLKKLEFLTLVLDNSSSITGAGLKQLTHSDLPLRFLSLRNCPSLPNDFCLNLSEGKPDLESLELKDCLIYRISFIENVASMQKLRSLLVTQVYLISDELLLISNMASLRKLEFRCCRFCKNSIHVLAEGSSPIDTLKLISCRDVIDVSLRTLSTMHRLRHLSLLGCCNVTEVGFKDLMMGNRNLISLDISKCIRLKSGALTCIMDSQPNQLQRLSMDRRHMDQESLALVSQRLRHLTVLYVPFDNLIAPKL